MQQEAQLLKEKGTKHVKAGRFDQASTLYGAAIDLSSKDATLFCNRALCYLKLNR